METNLETDLIKLVLLVAGALLGFALWRLILWGAYDRIGFRPLVLGYLFFLAAL